MRIDVGSVAELQESGYLTAKLGTQPLCVLWHEGRAYGIDDRCPHLGFPLHRGTVDAGMVTAFTARAAAAPEAAEALRTVASRKGRTRPRPWSPTW